MSDVLKLTYPLRSTTKYALLKSNEWKERSLEWAKEGQEAQLQIHFESCPPRLEWVFPSPVTSDKVMRVAEAFEKELFAMLKLQELMPIDPYIEAFHL